MEEIIVKIIEQIRVFDEMSPNYRFKFFDVFDYKSDIFVEYITKWDYDDEGKNLLMEELKWHSALHNQNIYLYYKVNKPNKISGYRNWKNKEGYTHV